MFLYHEIYPVIFTLTTPAILGAFLMLVLESLLGVDGMVAIQTSAAYTPLLLLTNVLFMIGLYK